MRLNLDELQYRVRNDYRFKKKLKRIVLVGGAALILLLIMGVVGIVLFSSTIISFLFAYAPGIVELGFNYVRGFASTYMQDDLTAMLSPLTGGANVNEMKNLVSLYFDKLSSNSAADFQNFTNFITSVKNSLADNQITGAELELVKKLLVN